MTFRTFKHKLHQLNFTVEYLELDEVDVVSLDPNQTIGSSPFPKEFTRVYLTHPHQMFEKKLKIKLKQALYNFCQQF